jgi:hypothetical protein
MLFHVAGGVGDGLAAAVFVAIGEFEIDAG